MGVPDGNEAIEAAVAEFVGSQPLRLFAVTTEAVYNLPKPVRMEGQHTDRRLDSVRVRMTRYPTSTEEGDHEGSVVVMGCMRPLNRDGTLRSNGVPVWRTLPERLAAQLMIRALTEGRPLPRAARVQKPPPPKED